MWVAVCNQKGGVGKTTTAINLSAYLALFGKEVLLVDLDPQANATIGLGFTTKEVKVSMYDVFTGEKTIEECVLRTEVENLYLAPSKIDLAGAEIELVNEVGRELILRKALKRVGKEFDYIIVDSPPNLGLFTLNALVACENVLVPIQAEYFPLEGLGHLLKLAKVIEDRLDLKIRFRYLLTMVDKRTRLGREVVEEVRKNLGERVFKTEIPRNIKLAEAPSHGKPIPLYDPNCTGALAYKKLAEEVVQLEEW